MNFFKIRHKPTGLFYKPSKYRSKANLSKAGKVYNKRPTLSHIGNSYHHPLPKEAKKEYESRTFIESDWEVVMYAVVEIPQQHTGECFSAPGPCLHGDEMTCKRLSGERKTISGPVLQYAQQRHGKSQ